MRRMLLLVLAGHLVLAAVARGAPQDVHKKLREAAKAPAFAAAVKKVGELTGAKPIKLETEAEGDDTGGVVFTVPHAKAEELLKDTRTQLLAQGVLLFRHGNGHGLTIAGQELPDEIALLPTKDKYDVLEAIETEGPNSNHYNKDVIAFLKDLEKSHPFELTEAGSDFLGGRFAQPVADAAALAKKFHAFDVDIEEEKHLEAIRKGVLYLWWD